MRIVCCRWTWLILVTLASPAWGAQPHAATETAEVDADYAFQGEFVTTCDRYGRRGPGIGVQVVALGKGEFQAALLEGGLPGAGWNRQSRTVYTGQFRDGVAEFRDSDLRFGVMAERGIVLDSQGRVVNRLARIRRVSPTLGAPPPPGALVLFDGSSVDQFEKGAFTSDGYLATGALTRQPVADFQLHLEFRTPYMPLARGQGRGNSGVYIQQRYELQILDSFGLEGVENECGGIYKQQRPALNMCLPPLTWQTYDIYFQAARWDEQGQKVAPARITAYLNGVPIHQDYAIPAKTGAGKPEGPEPLPILLQHHGNPVAFRNLWLVPGTAARSRTPCLPWQAGHLPLAAFEAWH